MRIALNMAFKKHIGDVVENLTPVLIRQATVYPNGRMNPTIIKGTPLC
jgi:hypothetical protein